MPAQKTLQLLHRFKGPLVVVFLLLLTLLFLLVISLNDMTPKNSGPILEFRSFDPGERLILTREEGRLQLGKALEYFRDDSNALDLEDILSMRHDNCFRPLWKEGVSTKEFAPYDGEGQDTKAVWVRFTLREFFPNEPVLLTTPSSGTILSAYVPDEFGLYRPSYHRAENNWRYFTNDPGTYLLLPQDVGMSRPVYIKMEARFKSRIILDFTALPYRGYVNGTVLNTHSKGIYVGFFLAILVFHIFLYLSTREARYYYYILFMFFLMLNRMVTTGISLWKYWEGFYYLENILYSFALAGLQICGIHFIRKTLVNRYDTKKINRLNRWGSGLYLFYVFQALLTGIFTLPAPYGKLLTAGSIGICMLLAYRYIFYAMSKGNRTALFYLLAFSPYFLLETFYALAPSLYGVIQSFLPYIRLGYLADFTQCTALACTVGQDIVRYKREKEISGQALRERLFNENKYLEKEVEERTRDLKKAIAVAESADRAKSRFLANVSHELRTPLGGIIGFAELINTTEDGETQRQYSRKILAESGHLLNLISDVLNLSRIESGSYEIESEPFLLGEVVRESLAGQIMLMTEKGLSFSLRLDEELPEVVVGDPHRLRQVLLNLTNNAQKFTPKGIVQVTAQVEEVLPDGERLIRFAIKDSGPGIPPEEAERIFSPFHQVDAAPDEAKGGTGLGTTISRRLVELMGGEIGYTPNRSGGSIFWFTLPFRPGSRAGLKQEEPREPVRGTGRILIVDDYQTNREITGTHLRSLGYTTFAAENGHEALDVCGREPFDLLLVDVHMPLLGGFETVKRIAAECPLHRSTPVLMLTAGGFDDESKENLRGNIKGIIYKPVRLNDISVRVAEILAPSAGSARLSLRSSSPPKILAENFLDRFEDREAGEEIFRSFLSSCRQESRRLEEHLREGDFQKLHRMAHSIKGGAMNLGLTDLAESAKEIEFFIKDKDFFPGALRSQEKQLLYGKIRRLQFLAEGLPSGGSPSAGLRL